MLLKLIFTFFVLLNFCVLAQNHEIAIKEVNSMESAKLYAGRFNDVSCSIVNLENDTFLFDKVDTAKVEESVGVTTTLFGRSTKFIKDTVVTMVEVRTIVFDLTKTSKDMAEILLSQMQKRLDKGESYWDLKKKYSHTSALFNSGPVTEQNVQSKYAIDLTSTSSSEKYDIDVNNNLLGLLIVIKEPHNVPGFYVISYNAIQ